MMIIEIFVATLSRDGSKPAAVIGISDVHAGALAHALQPLQYTERSSVLRVAISLPIVGMEQVELKLFRSAPVTCWAETTEAPRRECYSVSRATRN